MGRKKLFDFRNWTLKIQKQINTMAVNTEKCFGNSFSDPINLPLAWVCDLISSKVIWELKAGQRPANTNAGNFRLGSFEFLVKVAKISYLSQHSHSISIFYMSEIQPNIFAFNLKEIVQIRDFSAILDQKSFTLANCNKDQFYLHILRVDFMTKLLRMHQ